MTNATINTSATEFSPTWLKVNNVTVDKGSITKPDGIIYKIITSGTHNGHSYTWNGQMYVKAEIERHVRNPKSLMVGYEQLDNPPANTEVYGPEIDFRYQDFNNDFDIKDPVVYPYIQGGSVPPSDEMSKTDNTFKPRFINVQGNTYELKPKKPKIETKATIRSGASIFSATWLNEITQVSGVSNPNVYKITTSGEYKNKCYKWNGSQYTQTETFGYGEMAVNFSANNETIFVRNSNDEIVEIGKSNTHKYVDFVGSHQLADGTSSVGRGGLVPAPDKPDMFLSSSGGWENRSHCHGNVTNEGSVQGNPVNIQTGDGLLVTKASEYNKIVKADITFDKTVDNEYLRRDGTWAVPPGGGGGEGTQGVQGIQGIQGDGGSNGSDGSNGDSIFLSYSANADGSNNHSTFQSGDKYIGIYTGQSAPSDFGGYSWCKFVGDDGTAAGDTWRGVYVQGTQILDTSSSGNSIDFIYGDNVEITGDASNGHITISAQDSKVKQTALSSGSGYRPILLTEKSSPDGNNEAKYSTNITAGPASIVIQNTNSTSRIELTGDGPIQVQTRSSSSANWETVGGRLITSNGMVPDGDSGYILKSNGSGNTPTWQTIYQVIGKQSQGMVLRGNGTGTNDNNVSFGQLKLSEISGQYKTQLKYKLNSSTPTVQGTVIRDVNYDIEFPEIYAPTAKGIANQILISNGVGEPYWGTPQSYWINFQATQTAGAQGLNFKPHIKASTTNIHTTYAVQTENDWGSTVYNSNLTLYRDEGLRFEKVSVSPPNDNDYSNGLAIALISANTNEIGGIKVGAVHNNYSVTASTTDTTDNRTRYAVMVDKENHAYVNVPDSEGGTDTKNTVGTYTTPSPSHNLYLVGVTSNSTTDSGAYAQSYCPNQLNYIGTNGYLYARSGNSSSSRVITQANVSTGLTVLNNNLQLNMPLWSPTSESNLSELGGIITKGPYVDADPEVAESGTYYALQTDSSGVAMVRVPSGSGSGTVTSVGVDTTDGLTTSNSGNTPITATGTIGLQVGRKGQRGSIIVAENAKPSVAYINTLYITAVPVFYNKDEVYTYYYETSGEDKPYAKGQYIQGNSWMGHYVNIHDIVNGLIRNYDLLKILAEALGIPAPVPPKE